MQSGGATDEQVDQAIDAALPSAEDAQALPLNKIMAAASVASDAKRADYMPLLQMHAEHARQLPPEEKAQVDDHMALLGMIQGLEQGMTQ